MEELLIPEDYDILNSWVNEINGNDSEMENISMGFRRNNQSIIGYMAVDNSQKFSCLGDGICTTGKDNKPWIESEGCLGKGMYLYEHNYKYAVDIAKSQHLDIVGAVISLDNVLDFTDGTAFNIISENQEEFNQYINQLIQKYQIKMQSIKNNNSITYINYHNELMRLRNGNTQITDYFKFLDSISKKEKKYKYDAIRYITQASTKSWYNIPLYQATMLCLRDQKKVVEYFNPLNKQERDYIESKYFKTKNK